MKFLGKVALALMLFTGIGVLSACETDPGTGGGGGSNFGSGSDGHILTFAGVVTTMAVAGGIGYMMSPERPRPNEVPRV